MSLSKLPSEVFYDIIGYVIADYIDISISSPPQPSYLRPWNQKVIDIVRQIFSKRRSAKGIPHPVTIGSDKTEWSDFTEADFVKVLDLLTDRKALDETFCDGQDKKPAEESHLGEDEAIFDADDEHDDDEEDSDSDSDDDDDDDDDDWEDEESSLDGHSSLASIDTDYEIDSDDSDNDTEDDAWGHDEGGVTAEFRQWEDIESAEKLPLSAIQPLLGVNGMIRQVTLKIVYDALGIKRNKKGKSILARVDRVLHDLRKRFRLACTDGLGISDVYIPKFSGVETPLVDAYLTLSFSTYSLREYRAITMLSMDDSMKANDQGFKDIMKTLKATKYLAHGIPQYSLSTRMAQRAKIFTGRYKRYISCMKYIVQIRNTFDAAIETSLGPQNKPQFSFNEKKCSALRDAVHNFAVFDDKYMDKELYAEMPRQLIKSLPIRDMLLQVCKMRIIHEFRKNDDILSAAREAGELLDRWRRRAKNCRTFYVVLSKPPA